MADQSGSVRGGMVRDTKLASGAAGRHGRGADGPADPAQPRTLQQASASDTSAQGQIVARRDGQTAGVCFSRKQGDR